MSGRRRTRGHLAWDWVDRRLRSMREIWVATASAGGWPDAVPVWFWWDGEQIYFSTKAESRKARNLARHPHIVLHNGDGADPIILKGEAERVEDRHELERVNRGYADKYVAPESGERATIFVHGDVVLRVRPRRVLAWEYATCAYRTDWEFD
jgi:PPOX class probable F420-dependent enzyme